MSGSALHEPLDINADVLAPGGQMGMDRANGLLGLTRIYMEGRRCWHSGRACA